MINNDLFLQDDINLIDSNYFISLNEVVIEIQDDVLIIIEELINIKYEMYLTNVIKIINDRENDELIINEHFLANEEY